MTDAQQSRPPRPGRPTGLRRVLLRTPLGLYRAGLGWVLGGRFLMIEHVGRKSGLARQTVVEVVDREDDVITVASGWGPRADWYRNLRAHPDVTVQLGRRQRAVRATFPSADDAAPALLRYASRHPRAARALFRYMGAPVDGSEDSLRAAAHHVPWVQFVPRTVTPQQP